MKRPRPSKKLLQQTTPKKQIIAKVTEGSPNYMKATSSSETRRQRQAVQEDLDKKNQTGKKLNSCTNNVGDLKKGSSFKRSCKISSFRGVNARRGTCSSMRKDSKLSEHMMLASHGALKLCTYKYCSLNHHVQPQFPLLKSFVSARRRSLKSRESVKMSGEDSCVDIYVDEKLENESSQEVYNRVFYKSENVDMECREDGDKDKRDDELESESGEIVSLVEEGIESMEESCNIILSVDQESEKGSFVDDSINFLVTEKPIIKDDIIHCLIENGLDEKLVSKKAEYCDEADREKPIEKVEEHVENVSKTEETLFALASENYEEQFHKYKDSRVFNRKDLNYLPIVEETSGEMVKLKHWGMDRRKNTKEWMTDYALQRTVRKLAIQRKENVALLIEAFETISKRESSQ
ncbi:unnamed protein product [Cochlearia groenlandica]